MGKPIESYWELVEPIFGVVDIYNGSEKYLQSSSKVPRPSLLLFAAHMCLAETHNGGFLQFFWNNTGVLEPEAVEGFTVIGMSQMSSLLTEVAALLGSTYPRDREQRWDALVLASGHTDDDMERFVQQHQNLYLAFAEAAKSLPFDAMEQKFWTTAETENGGFQEAATRYARSLQSLQ